MSLPITTQCHLLPFTNLLGRIKYAVFHPFVNEAVTCIVTALTGRNTYDTRQCTPQFSKNVSPKNDKTALRRPVAPRASQLNWTVKG